jgi:hypothetical protein
MAVEVRYSGRKINNLPESWVIVYYQTMDSRGERKSREERRKANMKKGSQPFALTPTNL